jgi:hypothetical protein
MKNLTKAEFVSLLDAANLTETQKRAFHANFERRHPDAHSAFLQWLGVSAEEAAQIREHSR